MTTTVGLEQLLALIAANAQQGSTPTNAAPTTPAPASKTPKALYDLAAGLNVPIEHLQAILTKARERKFTVGVHKTEKGNHGLLFKFSKGRDVFLYKSQFAELLANLEAVKAAFNDSRLS